MAKLYSQYTSGQQFTAGTIVGSQLGTSGINALVDSVNGMIPSYQQFRGVGLTSAFAEIGSTVITNIGSTDFINIEMQANTFEVGSYVMVSSGTFITNTSSGVSISLFSNNTINYKGYLGTSMEEGATQDLWVHFYTGFYGGSTYPQRGGFTNIIGTGSSLCLFHRMAIASAGSYNLTIYTQHYKQA